MKLMTLNIWGGRVREPLFEFIKKYHDVDIFCFQELYNKATDKMSDDNRVASLNILDELKSLLSNHQSFFSPSIGSVYGIGVFVKKGISILDTGDVWIYEVKDYAGSGGNHSRNMQWLQCGINGITYSIFNVHGLWNGKGKTDSLDRIEQSSRIKECVDKFSGKKILCGDFNLRPDTKSIEIVSDGMDNLINKYKIKSTRTSIYSKDEKFADYVFVSPEVGVKSFEVFEDEVSDHSPLLLEFD